MVTRATRRSGQCKTCAHPEKARMELMLANDVDIAKVGRQFGISKYSVWRHYRDHVSEDRKQKLRLTGGANLDPTVDLEALKRSEGESLLAKLIHESLRLTRIADRAELVGNHQDAIRASTSNVRILELEAKLLGQIHLGGTTINNNFLLSPDWFKLRHLITTALRPFPEAQRALVTAIQEHERQAGADITGARAIDVPRPALEHMNGAASAEPAR